MNLDNLSVVVVEQNSLYRHSYAYVIRNSRRFKVIGIYSSGEEALKHAKRLSPDIVVTDIELPGIGGVELTRRFKCQVPTAEVIIVSRIEQREIILEVLGAGASGFIRKVADSFNIMAALEDIRNGGSPIDGKIARILINSFHTNKRSLLSGREQQILTLVGQGKTGPQISTNLRIALSTTKMHIRNIYSKLNVNKKSDALEFAYSNKLITRRSPYDPGQRSFRKSELDYIQA